ncbi:hypothetical protein BKA70DRAFT_1206406 [Coprinopsis sp. MPI-PUGE-AT-0042]|nr:hypothetical protein BKA70DRAFT_1206406 [Coprinopsis sp. MPI-PUGE-AT-0042]
MKLSTTLPDEIIKEILSPVLHVLDEAFASTSWRSPFSHYELSTSTVLVVCRDWLRVATPLLYHTVVIRSKAQAQALARTLKANAQLGQFIRKFRLEGGFGNAVFDILKRAPAITDIAISGNLNASESIGGYLRGFKLVNPRRLVYFSDYTDYKSVKVRKELSKALAESIRDTWTSLVSTTIFETDSSLSQSPIVDALQTRALTDLIVDSDQICRSDALMALAKLPSLREIRIMGEDPDFEKPAFEDLVSEKLLVDVFTMITMGPLYKFLAQDRSIYDKVIFPSPDFPEEQSEDIVQFYSAPTHPHYTPLGNVSDDLRATIWTRILRFSVELVGAHEITGIPPSLVGAYQSQGQQQRLDMQAFRASLTLVSKEFNACATPLLYEAPTICKRSVLSSLAQSPRRHLIKIFHLEIESDYGDKVSAGRLLSNFSALVSIASSKAMYTQVEESLMSWTASSTASTFYSRLPILYSSLAAAASTLQHLQLPLGLGQDASCVALFREVEALGQLHQLRSLVLAGSESVGQDSVGVLPRLPEDYLPRLQCLGLHAAVGPLVGKLLECLAVARLPSLQRFDMQGSDFLPCIEAFLKAHGRQLVVVRTGAGIPWSFPALCPNTLTWIVDDYGYRFGSRHKAPGMYDFTCLAPLTGSIEPALSTIVIPGTCFNPKPIEGLLQLDLGSAVPRLKRIEVSGAIWPTNQYDIEKSGWVLLAEALWEKFGIKLVDSKGRWWAPRLKVQKTKRK